ncbi:MAG TPA: homoserine kinase, partial [Candidatus Dormibacteraeota bacterium]|nr:homoserine kinase [Candidatus Dormibacteraeota bacterium]
RNPLSVLPLRGWVTNDIPLGVGLGSSAAARVAAAALCSSEDPIGDAGREEGHYDNVAAAVMGGVVAVVGEEVHGLPVPDLEVALFVAPEPLLTDQARAVLPAQVDRADAVFNAARLASLVQILHTRQWPMLDLAMEDRLHQRYRIPLYPWAQEVIEAAREAGAYGAAIAGAGPSVFAFCERRLGEDVAAAMEEAGPEGGYGLVTRATRHGLDVHS